MKIYHGYLMTVLAAVFLVTVTSGSSSAAIINKYNSPPKKLGVLHKKPSVAAHHIVTGRKNKNNDFANLNH
jgi:hypothetical protein